MAAVGELGVLVMARYGKDKVQVFRIVHDPESEVHNVVEYNVTILVEGAIEARCVLPLYWLLCPDFHGGGDGLVHAAEQALYYSGHEKYRS